MENEQTIELLNLLECLISTNCEIDEKTKDNRLFLSYVKVCWFTFWRNKQNASVSFVLPDFLFFYDCGRLFERSNNGLPRRSDCVDGDKSGHLSMTEKRVMMKLQTIKATTSIESWIFRTR